MAINVKQGTGLTLQQSRYVVPPYASNSPSILAGMVVSVIPVGSSGAGQLKPGSGTTTTVVNPGFAINNQTDNDVINSGYLGVYTLDGSSIIETDQADATINLTNYVQGSKIYGNATTGLVTATASTNVQVGWVVGVRSLPALLTVSGIQVPGFTNFLQIKLAAA
jgi:hypothetical protein